MRKVIEPAVAALQRAHLSGERVGSEMTIGDVPTNPSVSVIIPLYKALEFIRYQVAAFATDPDLDDAEIVYVLDSPEQAIELEGRLRALHGVYGTPFRLVVHHSNLGYAPAVNTGVSRSGGALLLLMNSDVVPAAERMAAGDAKAAEEAGGRGRAEAAVPRRFHPARGPVVRTRSAWPFLQSGGLQGVGHAITRRANRSRDVLALTGACLLLQRSVYDQVGGICEDYVVGDFEDTDFSLRVTALSMTLCYEPAAELYHYERQSIAKNESYTTTRACSYNRWLHAARWHEILERSQSDDAAAPVQASDDSVEARGAA